MNNVQNILLNDTLNVENYDLQIASAKDFDIETKNKIEIDGQISLKIDKQIDLKNNSLTNVKSNGENTTLPLINFIYKSIKNKAIH